MPDPVLLQHRAEPAVSTDAFRLSLQHTDVLQTHQHPDRTETGSVESSLSKPIPSIGFCLNRVSAGPTEHLKHKAGVFGGEANVSKCDCFFFFSNIFPPVLSNYVSELLY